MKNQNLHGLVLLIQELEASVDKSDALVRIEHSGKLLGNHIVANHNGMLALGMECVKASTQPSIDTEQELPLLSQSLSYLAGGDGEGINGLFVDNGIEYQKLPTIEELEEEDAKFSFSDLFFNLLIWGFVGFAGLGFVVAVRWLWSVVD